MNSAPSSDAAPAARPPLRRDSQRRMLLGVCSGIARTLDADPVLIRAVVIVIGLLAGPLAVVAYVATAVITPRDDGRMLLSGQPPDSRENWLGWFGVIIAACMLIASGPVFDGFWDGDPVATPLLAVALIAGVVVLIRANRDRQTPTPDVTSMAAPPATAPAAPAAAAATAAAPTASQAPTAPLPAVRTYAPRGGDTAQHSPVAPEAPKPSGPSIFLPVAGVITGAAAVAVLIDALGIADLSATAVAVLLAVGALGAGCAAAFARTGMRGRVITLVLAIVLAVSAAGTAALDEQFDDGVGYHTIRPAIAADIQPEYRLGVGLLELDLRDTPLPAGVTNVRAHVGAGEIQLRVAPDVQVVPVGDTSIDGRLKPLVATKDGAPPVLRVDADVDVGGPVDLIR
jgi:phage shock protein PspC (stress-responsive transcriptional regulator)